jgi:ABC-type sugar transport system permease subunit
LLQRVTTFVFVTGIIGSFQVFQQVYLMTHGGPLDSTQVIALLVYNTAFQDLRFGLASATAVVLFVIVGLLTLIQLRAQKSDWEF